MVPTGTHWLWYLSFWNLFPPRVHDSWGLPTRLVETETKYTLQWGSFWVEHDCCVSIPQRHSLELNRTLKLLLRKAKVSRNNKREYWIDRTVLHYQHTYGRLVISEIQVTVVSDGRNIYLWNENGVYDFISSQVVYKEFTTPQKTRIYQVHQPHTSFPKFINRLV